MRILVLSNLYLPAAFGGYERMCRDVVERFRRRGHEVRVLTSTFGGPVEDDDPDVERRLALSWNGREVVCPPLLRQIALERAGRRALARTLGRFRPDVVSVWGMGALSLGLLSSLAATGLPVVYVVGDDWLVYGRWADCWTRRLDDGSKPARLLARVLRLHGAPDADALAQTGAFCFVSDFMRHRAEEVGHVELEDAQVIPAGIDPGDFPVAPQDERPWRWRILCVGRLEPSKGFDAAIRALPQLLPEATLTVVGAGRHRDELARIAREAQVEERVLWTTCDRSEMATHYRAADALVFPSTGHEAFGLVPLEAMACGTPMVATGAGGSAEYLADGENSLLFPRSDPEALAGALRRLAADRGLRRRLVAAGLETAARLTVDRQAEELEAVHLAAARR